MKTLPGFGWRSALLLPVVSVFAGVAGAVGQVPDSYDVPIYINQNDYTSNRYTIWASIDGTYKPYLFDTGAPNLFTVWNAQSPSGPEGSFTFANKNTYSYYINGSTIGLGDSSGNQIVSTGHAVNVARVYQVTSGSGTVTPTSSSTGIGDGTWGDFGAGFYGDSTLATVLTQIPLGSGGQVGYKLDLTNPSLGQGTLTLGLTANMIQTAETTPGAITIQMNPSGTDIPTASGSAFGYTRNQVASTFVSLINGGASKSGPLGTVFDTGGGPNAIIYDDYFNDPALKDGNLTITYTDPDTGITSTIVSDPGHTPWPGSGVDVAPTTFDNPRVNPGGSIFDQYVVYFSLNEDTGANQAAGEVILVPVAVPEPASYALLALNGGMIITLAARRKRSVA